MPSDLGDCSEDEKYPLLVEDNGLWVTLPDWISSFLHNELRARNSPAGKARTFDRNLDATESQVEVYLGTYFPRSVAESFCIFDSLLGDKAYSSALEQEECIRICSVGTGTGGDLFGLILALSHRLKTKPHLEIVSIEGNKLAHEKAQIILEKAADYLSLDIVSVLVDHTFKAPDPFGDVEELLPSRDDLFHFVITSKFLNELDCDDISERPYFDFCVAFAKRLELHGVMMLLDVTSPNGKRGRWTPQALNGETNAFLKENRRFKTLLPLICNKLGEECEETCYTQSRINIIFKNDTNICSKICYRVIGEESFVEQLCCSTALWSSPITKDNESHCELFSRSK